MGSLYGPGSNDLADMATTNIVAAFYVSSLQLRSFQIGRVASVR
jgi:hypothetical protein